MIHAPNFVKILSSRLRKSLSSQGFEKYLRMFSLIFWKSQRIAKILRQLFYISSNITIIIFYSLRYDWNMLVCSTNHHFSPTIITTVFYPYMILHIPTCTSIIIMQIFNLNIFLTLQLIVFLYQESSDSISSSYFVFLNFTLQYSLSIYI